MPDAPLRLYCADGRLFAALANGTLTVLEVNLRQFTERYVIRSVPLLVVAIRNANIMELFRNHNEQRLYLYRFLSRLACMIYSEERVTFRVHSGLADRLPRWERWGSRPIGTWQTEGASALNQ